MAQNADTELKKFDFYEFKGTKCSARVLQANNKFKSVNIEIDRECKWTDSEGKPQQGKYYVKLPVTAAKNLYKKLGEVISEAEKHVSNNKQGVYHSAQVNCALK
jgi:hypothetical protein